MESLKKIRTPLRSGFTKTANKLDEYLEKDVHDIDEIEILMAQLNVKWSELEPKEKEFIDLLSNDVTCTQEDFDQAYEAFSDYNERYIRLKTKIKKTLNKVNDGDRSVINETVLKRKFKLPKIELKRFNGDVKEWLGFWGQFRKIHEDLDIAPEDKLQYLSQSTVEGSRARDIVDSFPPSAENYQHVIECLTARFGREDLLIEVYVRELLSLILNNSLNRSKTMRLASLYDKIEAHLRALETLGVTSDKYASMLYPLVESCLPEDIIRVWERSISLTNETNKMSNKLTALMSFLKSEVEGEERISIAKEGFGLDAKRKEKHFYPSSANDKQFPTAIGLFDAAETRRNKQTVCSFCERTHDSQACRTALKMTLEERRKTLARKGACFQCLKIGHRYRECKCRINCEKCKGRHYAVMCNEGKSKEHFRSKMNTTEMSDNQNVINDTALSNRTCCKEIILQTLYVRLRDKKGGQIIRALIDTGSQRSYLSKRVAKGKYDCIQEENVIHNLFGGKEHSEKHFRYRVFLSSVSGDYHCNFEVLDQLKICSDIPIPQLNPCSKELFENNIIVTDQLISNEDESLEIDLLIGADVAGKLLNGKIIHLSCGLVAVGTHLGWTLMGKVPYQDADNNSTMVVTNMFVKDVTITELWNLDIIGITDPATKKTREEKDSQAKLQFQSSVSLNNEGRYEVALPWSEDCLPLPTNKDIALRRLESSTQKLHSQKLFALYDRVFDNWQDLGMIEEVKQSEVVDYGHYLPHRPIIKESSSTTPVRPVFDASSRAKYSPSLNQCLECGPNLIELIPSILLRFREGKFAAIADIEKAFQQISIKPEDRDYLRFFWWNHTNENELRIFRHTRVVFGVKSSPFLLAAVIEFHLQKYMDDSHYDKHMLDKLLHSFYVDNVVTSFDDESEMRQFIEESQKIMREGKFNLRGWLCTGDDLQTGVVTPVLGLLWNFQKDVLTMNLNWLENFKLNEITKRTILAMTHKVYDPIGLVSPVLLFPKILLQNLWKTGISWDTEVDENTKELFLKWYKDIVLLKDISIPRWIHTNTDKKFCSIHTFCDASSNAYAAVVFLRIQTPSAVEVHLLASKSRVAPVKSITIPRLELIAATVGARLCTSVLEGLQWKDVELCFWTDSTTVLTWIQKEENWNVFVVNRVLEIRKLTNPNTWRHISGTDNPADLPSRGCTAKQLLAVKWWEGPTWLKKNESEWPVSELVTTEKEVNLEKRRTVISNLNCESTDFTKSLTHFSKYTKIVRMVAWILRFIYNCRHRIDKRNGELAYEEVLRAEKILLRRIQEERFADREAKIVKDLQTFKDTENILRVKTRLILGEETEDFKCPILLPGDHEIVRSLIYQKHCQLQHAGLGTLLCNLRETYWIISVRRLARKICSLCIICKRFKNRAVEPPFAPLPQDRIKHAAVFEVTGIDLAGPLYLLSGEKCWIVLFTCAIYRAVHIELVKSLSTECFIMALRRFIARRGRISIIYSDNGTNFVGANNAFRSLDWNSIMTFSTVQKIKWNFNPPTAAWWGGWWERMIRMIKEILRRILGRTTINYEELETILCDCEATINSRPLTYVSNEAEGLKPLTPATFLQGIPHSNVPDFDNIDSNSCNKRLRYLQKLRVDLRTRFRNEYLAMLVQRGPRKNETLKVGDVVLIETDSKRLNWPLALVLEVFPGTDGNARVARLKTAQGEKVRPFQRLYPLELSGLSEPLMNAPQYTREPSKERKSEEEAEIIPTVTRFGRKIKVPERMNL